MMQTSGFRESQTYSGKTGTVDRVSGQWGGAGVDDRRLTHDKLMRKLLIRDLDSGSGKS